MRAHRLGMVKESASESFEAIFGHNMENKLDVNENHDDTEERVEKKFMEGIDMSDEGT